MEDYIHICIELVARHYDKDEYEFKEEALCLADRLHSDGKEDLADYIIAQVFSEVSWTTQ